MEIVAARTPGKILIKSYGPGQFEIGEDLYFGSILLCGNAIFRLDVANIEELSRDLLAEVFDAQPKVDVFLIGWGSCQTRLNEHLGKELETAGIGVDLMNTGAACRTYNVLVLDEREVAAALLPL